jgi:hypothetical protein
MRLATLLVQRIAFYPSSQTEISNRRYAWWLKNGLKKRSNEGMVDKMELKMFAEHLFVDRFSLFQ